MNRRETSREQTRRGLNKRSMDDNFFRAMNYELAGEIGAIDGDDMMNNNKLLGKSRNSRSKINKMTR